MTEDDLIEYNDLINGSVNGKYAIRINNIDDQKPKTLLVGCTRTNQMIHIYLNVTRHGDAYFSVRIHGNEAGGFKNATYIQETITISDIENYKITTVFSDFSKLSFLKLLYLRLGHFKPKLVQYISWFEKCCTSSGYPSQLALYISEDILSAKNTSSEYDASVC